MELTVESLIAELGLELASGHESAKAHVRWVHSTELLDPTPWLKGGELLLIDAGCEYDFYASDVTRTFPVGARFNPRRVIPATLSFVVASSSLPQC